MVIFLIVSIMCMRVLQSLFNKRACLALPDGMSNYILYITISNAMAAGFALITIFLSGDFSGFDTITILIATCSGLFLALNSYVGIKSLQGGPIVLSSLFGTAGLFVPCILGAIFFDETLSFPQIICILAFLVAALLLVDSSKKIFDGFSMKTLVFLILNLISNGMVMFSQKLFGMCRPEGNVALFSFLTFLIPTVFMAIILPFIYKKEQSGEKLSFPKKLSFYALILAFAVFVVNQFVTLLTPKLSSAVLFTSVNGSATIISAIVGAVVYKEKITWKSALGILIGIAALICIKIFE